MKGLEDMLGVQWGRRERTLLEGWGTAFPESVLRPTLPGPQSRSGWAYSGRLWTLLPQFPSVCYED